MQLYFGFDFEFGNNMFNLVFNFNLVGGYVFKINIGFLIFIQFLEEEFVCIFQEVEVLGVLIYCFIVESILVYVWGDKEFCFEYVCDIKGQLCFLLSSYYD